MLVSNIQNFRRKNKGLFSTAVLAQKTFEIQLKPPERKVSPRRKFEKAY